MSNRIRCKKDLYNKGKCFTAGKVYELPKYQDVQHLHSLIDTTITNDLGEPHIIGIWWRDFEIVHDENTNT